MSIGIKLAITLLLVALNGFYVAAEFAAIRIRQTRIAELVEQGSRPALMVQGFQERIGTYLSATQLGVTLASLTLGAIGEPAMASLLSLFLEHIGVHVSRGIADTLVISAGVLVIPALHIIFGELLPKWWVLTHTESTALAVAGPMKLTLLVCFPLVKALEATAIGIAKLLRIDPGDAHSQVHSEDEILAIMAHAHRQGELRPSEIEIAENVFDFAHTQAKEIMVPRVDIMYLSTSWTIEQNIEVAVTNGFTRYPLCEGDRDHVIGMIHIKDLLSISNQPDAEIRSIRRDIAGIPETKPIDELLKELQKSHTHQAIVLDEYGGTAGMVTLEDILEELVGEIQDEYDKPPPIQKRESPYETYSVAPAVSIDELSEILQVPIDNPDEFETVGGYVLHQLHLLPRVGAVVTLDRFEVKVTEVLGRRIRRLEFCKHTSVTDEPAQPHDT